MLLQAYPYLSGFLFGLCLLRLLWCCDWGPGARTCHHVLAKWEMGLHWRALRFLALRNKEVHCKGDLRWLKSFALLEMLQHILPRYSQTATRHTTTSSYVHWCSYDRVMYVLHVLAKCQDFLCPFFFITHQYLCNSVREQKVSQISITQQWSEKPRNLSGFPNTCSGYA